MSANIIRAHLILKLTWTNDITPQMLKYLKTRHQHTQVFPGQDEHVFKDLKLWHQFVL